MIDFQNVYKSYSGKDIFKDVSFRINPGERVGVVGPNGAGKSTIFSIVNGEIEQDKGKVMVPRDLRIAILHQHIEHGSAEVPLLDFAADAVRELSDISARMHVLEHRFHEQLEPGEYDKMLAEQGELQSRYEQLGGYRLRHAAEAALSGLGFHEEDFLRPLGSFSGGWQMRGALARVLISDPDILLLDEPSNYLDIPAVEWLYRFLKSFKGTLMLISHDRFLLKTLANVTLEINGGNVIRYAGDYDYYVRERQNRYLQLESARKNQDKERERLERSIDRFRSKSTKAVQVQNWIRKLDRMEEITMPDELHYSGSIRIPDPPPCGNEIIRLENLSFSYNGTDMVLENIDIQVDKGDKLGIVGYNGMGKTTLLKVMAGMLTPAGGKCVIGHNVVSGYQAQEFSELLPDEQSAYDVVRAALPAGADSRSLMSILGSFGFSGEAADKPCKVLSGGEKIRLLFARIFVNPPNFLLLDEPTTHLDISAREALQQALADYKGTVVFVSHDIEFVSNVAENIIGMVPHGIKRYYGNYAYYREKVEQEKNPISNSEVAAQDSSASDNQSAGTDSQKERRKERARVRQEMQKEKRELERRVAHFEQEIERAESEQAEITASLALNSADTDFAALNRRLKELEQTIAKASSGWEQFAVKLEEFMEEYNRLHD
ncbi:MAG: ATP-binding cassette domain-containing protein [Victivallales bacterium]|nr:ATP-binding cassette domain-containing protein [Victivallales bacterium]